LYRNIPFSHIIMIIAVLSGCTVGRQTIPPNKLGEDIEGHPAVIQEETGVDARSRASSALMLHACILLDNNQPDDAIDLLERAIALDPKEGRNYYYLARGWIIKGNAAQAFEFNSLAEIYLGYDEEWAHKVTDQKNEIHQMK
jgi:predicted Zn-dependent protease